MKKILIVLMTLSLVFITILPMTTNAGAPKLIYEIGDTFVDASIKAIQARKGFKVVDGGAVTEKPTEVFTNAIKKGFQDTAKDSWEVIKGGKLNATPLKDMPGWLKVTIGTAAFISGADIAFDIYEMIQNGQNINTLTMDASVGYTMMGDTFMYYVISESSKYDTFQIYAKDGFNIKTGSTTHQPHKLAMSFLNKKLAPLPYMKITSLGVSGISVTIFYSFYSSPDILSDTRTIEVFTADGSPIKFSEPFVAEKNIPYEFIQRDNNVPNINTSRPTQTLIVPNPDFFPDVDKAIQENWDMVSDPDGWLQRNPQNDPDANPNPNPNPNPDLNPNPDAEPFPKKEEIPPTIPPDGDGCKSPAEDLLTFFKNSLIGNFSCFDWDKLKMAGGFFTNKFPFSVPWDVGRALDAVFGGLSPTDDVPSYNLKIKDWSTELTIPEFFKPWFTVIRVMLLVMFDIGLIWAIRKMLGGAS